MATHPIAADPKNLAVNILRDLNQFLGKLANRKDVSKEEYVKQLIHDGLKLRDPQSVEKWDRVKTTRFDQAVSLCFTCSVIVWQSLLGNLETRRAPQKEQVA